MNRTARSSTSASRPASRTARRSASAARASTVPPATATSWSPSPSKPHDFYVRDGDNLRIHVPVTFPEAALGADIEVPTIDGDTVRVRVPAGTPSGRTLRVKGRGVKHAKATGDLLVTIDVAVPRKLNKEAEEAVKAFAAATAGEDVRAGLAAKARL